MADDNRNRNDDDRVVHIDDFDDEAKEKKRKRKKFNWFGMYSIEGRGVDKSEPDILDKPTFGNFFKLLGRRWQKLISVNIMYILGNFPIFFYLIYRAGYFGVDSTAPYYQQFAPLYGAAMFHDTHAVASLYGIFGIQVPISANTWKTVLFFVLTGLLFFTFGFVKTGVTYITRTMLRGDPVFLWQDFSHAIKKNWRQALPMGIIDLLAMLLLTYDIRYFWGHLTSAMMYVMFYISLFMFLVYFIMRFYAYLIMITFDLSLYKILKNSLIFVFLGVKRNLLGFLCIVVVIAANYLLFGLYIPVGLALPFIFTISLILLIETYAAYPKIKQFMIDPYYGKNGEPIQEDANDAGTENA